MDGSPQKRRKIAYMDEDEDHGESLAVSGRTVVVNGGDANGKHKKAKRKTREIQEQRAQLPIAKGESNFDKLLSALNLHFREGCFDPGD